MFSKSSIPSELLIFWFHVIKPMLRLGWINTWFQQYVELQLSARAQTIWSPYNLPVSRLTSHYFDLEILAGLVTQPFWSTILIGLFVDLLSPSDLAVAVSTNRRLDISSTFATCLQVVITVPIMYFINMVTSCYTVPEISCCSLFLWCFRVENAVLGNCMLVGGVVTRFYTSTFSGCPICCP